MTETSKARCDWSGMCVWRTSIKCPGCGKQLAPIETCTGWLVPEHDRKAPTDD